jgi:hypothetical protein
MRLSTLNIGGGGGTKRIRQYTADGTFVFPTGVSLVRAFLQAGGGSGATNESVNSAGGGNGGDALVDFPIIGDPGDTLAIVVGAGGAAVGGSINAAVGIAGGDTTITLPNGLIISVTGGKGAPPTEQASVDLTRLPNYIPGGTGANTGINPDGQDILGAGSGGIGLVVSGSLGGLGGGGAFFGDGLNGGANTTPAEVWDPDVNGYGGGGGGFYINSLLVTHYSGAGGDGAVWLVWEGAEYGT